jgi:ankyrin repeat protein
MKQPIFTILLIGLFVSVLFLSGYKKEYYSIYYASGDGNLAAVKKFVKESADINAKDHFDRTPLFNAAENDNLEVVKYFIEKGVDMNAKNSIGSTPLAFDAEEEVQ